MNHIDEFPSIIVRLIEIVDRPGARREKTEQSSKRVPAVETVRVCIMNGGKRVTQVPHRDRGSSYLRSRSHRRMSYTGTRT